MSSTPRRRHGVMPRGAAVPQSGRRLWALSIAVRRRIKRVVMWMHGYLFLPDFSVSTVFRLFRLRSL